MFRERLRSKEGCTRCRERKKKCDEQRPTCSFCLRWHLHCRWPAHEDPSRPPTTAVQHDLTALCRAPQTTNLSLDPFEHDQSEMVDHLRQFVVMFARLNLPLEDVGARNELAQHWFEAALHETIVCHATLSCWTKIQSQLTNHAGMRQLGITLEIQTLSSLRRQIESGLAVPEHVLLAAAIHFVSAALDVQDGVLLRRMLYGIEALVNSCGGIHHVVEHMAACTVFCVQHTDIFSSMANADKPLFVRMERPPRPASFTSVYNPRPAWDVAKLEVGIGSEILEGMDLVEFLLCFKLPSRQTRKLNRAEFGYLYPLEHWLNYQLAVLQHKYMGTSHVDEVAVTAALIVKLEVFAEGSSHAVLITAILNRLKTAIRSLDLDIVRYHDAADKIEDFTVWAAVVALVGQSLLTKRVWFLERIQSALIRRYGKECTDWPASVDPELREQSICSVRRKAERTYIPNHSRHPRPPSSPQGHMLDSVMLDSVVHLEAHSDSEPAI